MKQAERQLKANRDYLVQILVQLTSSCNPKFNSLYGNYLIFLLVYTDGHLIFSFWTAP